MTIVEFLVFVRSCGAIEPCLFVAYYSTMFPTAVSSVDPKFQRQIFLHNMESSRSISRKEIWKIRRGGQGTNRVFRGKKVADMRRSGVYRDILCGGGLSSIFIGGRYKSGLPKSAVKLLLNQS